MSLVCGLRLALVFANPFQQADGDGLDGGFDE